MSDQTKPVVQHDQSNAHHDDHGHHHHHGHEHDPQHAHLSHDDRNITHWNKVAKTYNSDNTQKEFGDLINKTHAFVLSNISSIGVDFNDPSTVFESSSTSNDTNSSNSTQKSIRVLDYACGPGTITNILAGRATEYIGLDITPNMVAEYNERFSSTTTSDDDDQKLNAHAYTANLFSPSGPPEPIASDPKFFNFDLVAVGFGFHHFENLPMVTSRLVERLAPGGVLMIIDFFTHKKDDLKEHEAINTIAHHGFTEESIKGLFAGAGLDENLVVSFDEDVLLRGHAKRRPFMARGRKPKL